MTTLKKEKLYREKFALLARVGVNKRKASAYQEAEEFYSTLVTEQAVALKVLVELVQHLSEQAPVLRPLAAEYVSHQHRLVKKLLNFWPKNSDSRERLWNLLESKAFKEHLEVTPDGYISLATDQILGNVAQVLGATQEDILSPS